MAGSGYSISSETPSFISEAIPIEARRLFTRQEFERAGVLQLFSPEERLELIAGEVIRKMSPQRTRHATAVSLAAEVLRRLAGKSRHVRVQLPLALSDYDEPEPDLAVVKGSPRDYLVDHPSNALLVVEVADSTLRLDRTTKAALYARAGIAEYWIVNVVDDELEAHRDPAPQDGLSAIPPYRTITRLEGAQRIAPLFNPKRSIRVSDLLP